MKLIEKILDDNKSETRGTILCYIDYLKKRNTNQEECINKLQAKCNLLKDELSNKDHTIEGLKAEGFYYNEVGLDQKNTIKSQKKIIKDFEISQSLKNSQIIDRDQELSKKEHLIEQLQTNRVEYIKTIQRQIDTIIELKDTIEMADQKHLIGRLQTNRVEYIKTIKRQIDNIKRQIDNIIKLKDTIKMTDQEQI